MLVLKIHFQHKGLKVKDVLTDLSGTSPEMGLSLARFVCVVKLLMQNETSGTKSFCRTFFSRGPIYSGKFILNSLTNQLLIQPANHQSCLFYNVLI